MGRDPKEEFLVRFLLRAATLGGVIAMLISASTSVFAEDGRAGHAVFVETNGTTGNAILAYHRADDGTLTQVASYPTGGLGGAATGAAVDPLASQGALAHDSTHRLLLAVNAGSDSVSVFAVDGDNLRLSQVVGSGGSFPASVAVSGNLAYVLNAGGDGGINGYRIAGGKLHPIEGSSRVLGLGNANPPFFLASPGQIGFTPDGDQLIVTTKKTGTIDVFNLSRNGRPSATPAVTASAGPVPFAFAFDRAGWLIVTEAGSSSVTSYNVDSDGSLAVVDAGVQNHQAATCWVTVARGFFFVANAGSADLSGYAITSAGTLSLINGSQVAASTGGGPIDMAASGDGRFLYVESGGTGTVDEFHVDSDGTLVAIGVVAAAPGLEGIVAV
jgi:6-phosphogluconolactonase (cycloisomerase 2 family)